MYLGIVRPSDASLSPGFQCGRNVRDLFMDLRDGKNLLGLLEVLSGERLVSRALPLFLPPSLPSSPPYLRDTGRNTFVTVSWLHFGQ